MALGGWVGVGTLVADDGLATLFPASEPFESGFLRVSELHQIHYQLHGNPKGKPVIVLHGGPGVGCYPRLVQYFDPQKWLIVLHDQRGAGRSLPAGEVRENTTADLVADIERLRAHLKIGGPVLVFGGSWGSTLGLAYAEAHPEHVSGLVLRGIWTGTAAETCVGYGGGYMRNFLPDYVAAVEEAIPAEQGAFNPETLHKIFAGDDKALQRKVLAAWVRYATAASKVNVTPADLELGDDLLAWLPSAIIDTYYAKKRVLSEGRAVVRGSTTATRHSGGHY